MFVFNQNIVQRTKENRKNMYITCLRKLVRNCFNMTGSYDLLLPYNDMLFGQTTSKSHDHNKITLCDRLLQTITDVIFNKRLKINDYDLPTGKGNRLTH